jgi:hypothetical protein
MKCPARVLFAVGVISQVRPGIYAAHINSRTSESGMIGVIEDFVEGGFV